MMGFRLTPIHKKVDEILMKLLYLCRKNLHQCPDLLLVF